MSREKNNCTVRAMWAIFQDVWAFAGVCGRKFLERWGCVGLVACLTLTVLAGGCASQKLKCIKNLEDFEQHVIYSDQPVLLEFYKGGCPTCITLEPSLARLAEEFQGRVAFVRFELMTPIFVVRYPELKDQYDVSYFPTVILFVDGQEKKRWILNYDIDSYREALNEVAAPEG